MAYSPFLSILIPVYNWDIGPLLKKLADQCTGLTDKERVEIIVIDDGSRDRFDNAQTAEQFSFVIYRELAVNRGRVAVRNELLDQARGQYVLFLDADMLPDHSNFLQIYLDQADSGNEIVCGGISYLQRKEDNDTNHTFYLYKSKKTEALPAETRNRIPWKYLFTSNIMLRTDIVDSIRFDPRFTGYGYEDVEWAIRLSEKHTIKHIDNTCSHMGVMNKQQVLENMRESIGNYALLITLHPEETRGGGAVTFASRLKFFPVRFLQYIDTILSKLFSSLGWNPLLFFIFQCDKVVLLARALKEKAEA
jgi:glycosyltransferase involved in cell wall biosynthesis